MQIYVLADNSQNRKNGLDTLKWKLYYNKRVAKLVIPQDSLPMENRKEFGRIVFLHNITCTSFNPFF